jgi:DNA-binding NarL/FixJ family response regulator
MSNRRIFIVEDHPVMRKSLAAWFAETGRWQVQGSAANLEEAKAIIAAFPPAEEPPEIVVVDIQLETGKSSSAWGLDLIPWLREQQQKQGWKKAPIAAVYSQFNDYAHVNAAFSMGAAAYISKNSDEQELEAALHTVLAGGKYVDKTAEFNLKNAEAAVQLLTKREAEILGLVNEGLTNRLIAEKLGISRRTVENILLRIYCKTGIGSRLELQKL